MFAGGEGRGGGEGGARMEKKKSKELEENLANGKITKQMTWEWSEPASSSTSLGCLPSSGREDEKEDEKLFAEKKKKSRET